MKNNIHNNIHGNIKHNVIKKFLLFAILFIISNTFICAAEEIELTEIKVNWINSLMEDGVVETVNNLNDNGEYEVHGHINTKNLEEGYYTAFIYDKLNSDWSSYDGFSFHIENNGEEIIDINFNIQGNNGINLRFNDRRTILIKNDNSSMIEKVMISNGIISIYPGFDGNVYIPFESLIDIDNDKRIYKDNYKDILSEINLWVIPITCKENIKINFRLSGFSVINLGEIKEKYVTNDFQIIGNNRMMIPTAGESMSKYDVNAGDNIVFQIPEYIENIYITKDGILNVNDSFNLNKIRICAGDGSICETKEIELYNSWFAGKLYNDGVNMSILKSNEMNPIILEDNIFLNNKLVLFFRVIIVFMFILFWILFLYWRNRFKNIKK